MTRPPLPREELRRASIVLTICLALIAIQILRSIEVAAEPVRLEVQAGKCQMHGADQGSWWLGEPMQIETMIATCYQLGVSRLVTDWGKNRLGWRAAWVDLGHFDLQETAYGGAGVQPHWSATGSGTVYGATFGALIERPISSSFDFTAEAGLFAYRSKWEAVAFHHAPPAGRDRTVTPDPRYGATLYAGAGLGYRVTKDTTLTLSARIYPAIYANTADKGDNIGPRRANAFQLMLGLQVPLR